MSFRVCAIGSIILAAALFSDQALGRTWFVEQDGTGDFTVIQDAVDAAASGDTVRIGPGRFDEGQTVVCPGWTRYVRVLIEVEELTLIGAGPDQTIIGPAEPWDLDQGWHVGIVGGGFWNSTTVRITGLRVENTGYAVYSELESLEIANCAFDGNAKTISSLDAGQVTDIKIDNCAFSNPARDYAMVYLNGVEATTITNCIFDIPEEHNWIVDSITTVTSNFTVEHCEMTGGKGSGIVTALGSNGIVRDCFFHRVGVMNWWVPVFYVAETSTLDVADCELENVAVGFKIGGVASSLHATRCRIEGVLTASVWSLSDHAVVFNDCDLARGEEYVVICEETGVPPDPPIHYDFRNCYWGTDEPDSIQAWILDGNDDPDLNYIVDWEPFATESTPVEKTSLGDLKALFR